MNTITIKIEGNDNVIFFINLLKKFNFIKEIKINNKKPSTNKVIEEASIDWAKTKPSINDFIGIWSDNSITINEIRSKGWKRS